MVSARDDVARVVDRPRAVEEAVEGDRPLDLGARGAQAVEDGADDRHVDRGARELRPPRAGGDGEEGDRVARAPPARGRAAAPEPMKPNALSTVYCIASVWRLGCSPIGPSPSRPSDSRKPACGESRSRVTHHRKPASMRTADDDRGRRRRAGAGAPPRRAAALELVGDRGHGDEDPRPPSGGPPSRVRMSRSPIRRGGSGSIWLRPATRETRSPAKQDQIQDGRGEADQRLDPALRRELTGGAMRHGGRL